MEKDKKQLQQYLLRLIDRDDREYAAKTAEAMGVALSTVYNYVKRLCTDGIIEKDEKRKCSFSLSKTVYDFVYKTSDKLSEDRIFITDIEPLLENTEANVYDIWCYAFSEMMNNAIEHSGAEEIRCRFIRNAIRISIIIADNGEGIFRHIQRYLKETTGEDVPLKECPGYLLPGRFTTDRRNHSGEGIFFTSHMMDRFSICSQKLFFTRDNFEDSEYESKKMLIDGTLVYMSLFLDCLKTPMDVFNRFSDVDEGFFRTQIPLSHLFPNGYPVSRSEARRLAGMIKDFKEVILDFSGIENLGQAFVHEFFIVQKETLSGIDIQLCNLGPNADFMIKRVKNTK